MEIVTEVPEAEEGEPDSPTSPSGSQLPLISHSPTPSSPYASGSKPLHGRLRRNSTQSFRSTRRKSSSRVTRPQSCMAPPWFSPGRTRLRELRSASACSQCPPRNVNTPDLMASASSGVPVVLPVDVARFDEYVRNANRFAGPRANAGHHAMTFQAEVSHSTAEDNAVFSDEEEAEASIEMKVRTKHSFFQRGSKMVDEEDEEDDEDRGSKSPSSSIIDGVERAITEGKSGSRFESSTNADGTLGAKFLSRRMCSATHSVFLRDNVYMSRCSEMRVNANTGVKDLLIQSSPCFCWLQVVSFRDLLLGDRGILGVLTLFQYTHVLRSLSFAGNGLREAGVRSVLSLLQEPGRLKHLLVLDLSHNPVGAASAEGLGQLLTSRKQLALLGLHATTLPGPKRQLLLRRSLANFVAADPQHMLQAWRLARDYANFSDRDLWVTCTPAAEARFGRQLHGDGESSGGFDDSEDRSGESFDEEEEEDSFAALLDDGPATAEERHYVDGRKPGASFSPEQQASFMPGRPDRSVSDFG